MVVVGAGWDDRDQDRDLWPHVGIESDVEKRRQK
jgi:hypothetical protein